MQVFFCVSRQGVTRNPVLAGENKTKQHDPEKNTALHHAFPLVGDCH